MEIITEPGTQLFLLILVSGGLIFYYLKIKYLEELARIEHGLARPERDANRLKKLGLISIAIGIGILFGYLVGKITGMHQLVTVPSMILIIGGGSLLIVNQMK